jgi:hypothetical protein
VSAPEFGGRATREACARIAERARTLAESLNVTHTLHLRMATEEGKHLLWFDDGTKRGGAPYQPKRPVLTLDGRAREAGVEGIAVRLLQGLRDGDRALAWLPAITVGAGAIRTVWLDRLDHNGADLALAPLSPKYLHRKVARGLDPRTGIATGAMRQGLAGALIVVSRIK